MNSLRRRRVESSEESGDELNVPVVKRPKKKKQRRNDRKEVHATLEDQMVKLCDLNAVTANKRIEDLISFIGDSVDSYKMDIMRILVECIEKKPMQSATYATFVGLLNAEHYDFGGECLTMLQTQLNKSLTDGQWSRARSILLLQADLVNANVLTSNSMLHQLATLTSVCEEEDSTQRRRDFYVYLVLSTLPLVGRELYEKKETTLNALLKRLLDYVKEQRKANADGVQRLRIWSNDEMPQQDYLEQLWHQILRLQSENWVESQLERPYLKFDDKLSSALQHSLPALETPRVERDSNITYPRPWLNFRLFQQCDIPSSLQLPDDLDIGRHVIELQIMEILQLWHLERKICADQLLAYAATKPKIAMQHLIVEVLFGQMLKLPSAPYLIINYGSIIIELCKLQPFKLSRIVAHATCLLFKQLEFMSVSCIDRFVDWFTHHLSNFRFQWTWLEWLSCTTLPELHPSSMFVRELLKKCMRLSYYQKIEQIMPSAFAALLPPAPMPNFKYLNELLPGAKLAKALLEAIRGKAEPMLIGGIMEATTDLDNNLRINVIMQTFLHLGCKTFTHINSIFCKYLPVLKMISSSEDSQLSMLRALFEVWESNEQLKIVLADKLMKLNIVSTRAIVTWIFDPTLKQELVKMYLWELLDLTIRFTKTHLRTISKEQQESLMKGLLLQIVDSSVKVLLEHHKTMQDKEGELTYPDYWFHWVSGRLQALLFKYIDDVSKISHKLRQLTFELDNCKPLLNMIEDYLNFTGY